MLQRDGTEEKKVHIKREENVKVVRPSLNDLRSTRITDYFQNPSNKSTPSLLSPIVGKRSVSKNKRFRPISTLHQLYFIKNDDSSASSSGELASIAYCKECGLGYMSGIEDARHARYHASNSAGIQLTSRFTQSKGSFLTTLSGTIFQGTEQVIYVSMQISRRESLFRIVEQVNRAMGIDADTEPTLNVSSRLQFCQLHLCFLKFSNNKHKRVIGALLTEPLNPSKRLYRAELRKKAFDEEEGRMGEEENEGTVYAVGAPIEAELTTTGVLKVWVEPGYRRQGIASQLLHMVVGREKMKDTLISNNSSPLPFCSPNALGYVLSVATFGQCLVYR